MRRNLAVSFFVAVLGAACGSSPSSGFTDGDGDGGTSTDPPPGFIGAGDAGKAACVGLGCQQVECGGGVTTTVSGTVWDPAGKNPVYNAVVYVPNAPVDPIKHGPVCDSCGGAPVSGSPLVTALTDATGAFTLQNVPVGANIPIVIQVGKWRRQLTIAAVNKCVDNPMTDATQTRLPKNKGEGDMPLIALTGGCDPIHTLVQKIGVDPAEFTTASGNGMVHVYSGKGYNGGVPGSTDAYAFWGTLSEMMKYDIIINECECTPYPRDTVGPAYENMRAYLDSGGRVFNSHYHLNFFGSSTENGGKPAAELQSAANWALWSKSSGSAPFLIDTSFPKGKAMDDWLANLSTASKWGPTIKTSPKGQIKISNNNDIGGAVAGVSQRWIYSSTGPAVVYVSINTPTSAAPAARCGRAVATDLHVGSPSLTAMTEQEAALEFMFFDLASCVIDDGVPPTPPAVK